MTDVELDGVRKAFDDVTAVDGVDLSVRDGEFVVLVGPSGCGKSTTLRCLAGLEDVTGGRIRAGGREITGLDPSDRNVAMVFQDYALYPHMTARRNMSFGATSASSLTDEAVERRVAEAAETLDISDLLDRTPDELSGGERQRVAIGRALVRDPDILLMDEPLSNLDAKLRLEMRTELARLHEQLETTTVYVTHDQTEAMTLGDRVAVMRDGSFEQVARPQTLYDYPESEFVAEFIGEPATNTVPVRVEERDGGYVATSRRVRVPLPASDDLPELVGRDLHLGVRPEDFHRDADERNHVTVEVAVVEPLGDVALLTGLLDGTELRVEVDARSGLRQGSEVEFGVDPDRLHLFDPATGDALYHSGRDAATREQPATR